MQKTSKFAEQKVLVCYDVTLHETKIDLELAAKYKKARAVQNQRRVKLKRKVKWELKAKVAEFFFQRDFKIRFLLTFWKKNTRLKFRGLKVKFQSKSLITFTHQTDAV